MSPTSYQLLYPAIFGAGDRDRTGTGSLPRNFKSRASANSATPAWVASDLLLKARIVYHMKWTMSSQKISFLFPIVPLGWMYKNGHISPQVPHILICISLLPGVCQFRHSGIWCGSSLSSAYLEYHKPRCLSRENFEAGAKFKNRPRTAESGLGPKLGYGARDRPAAPAIGWEGPRGIKAFADLPGCAFSGPAPFLRSGP